nr:candidate crown gall disease resistance protein 2 [Malus hybrid cultivar]
MANQHVPSSFSPTPSWTYDVFLSFRGEDTRTNFTDHLHQALVRHGIHTFIDHSGLPIGEEISPTLLEAIENSRISVIIFSENYASSRWCLDELVHILECRKSKGQMTRPIFYKVDPSDVRHQRNSYGAAFANHSCRYDLEKVQRWKTALTEAADLKGATLNKEEYETAFINGVVEEISTQVLNRTYLHLPKHLVGIESCLKEVEELLGVGGHDGRVVGIWGTSGIGKTTIAKAVYNAISHKFEGSCFLEDVKETSTSRAGVLQLQNTLLSEISRGSNWNVVNTHQGISLIEKLVRGKKILLILDDVDQREQLDNLIEVDWFSEGCRVIITTKDRGLLESYGVGLIYEVQKLKEDKALELFSLNAFRRIEPPDNYFELAKRAIGHAQGLPLALNIIGSHMHKKSIDRWQAVLTGYDSYDGEPYRNIQRILRKSYDDWSFGLQQIFLHIACFFKGEDKDCVLHILRNSKLNVREDSIEVLVEKAIITIEHNRILMHDLLEQMGKHIVWEESPDEPGKRSRLWHYEDVCNVLSGCRGTKKIRGIVVNLPKPDVILLNAKSFSKMINLEFFINRNAHFSGRVDYLPNSLRLIEFGGRFNIHQKHTYVLNLPSNFHPRDLVSFDVTYSGIRQLKGFKNLAKLTWMNLSGCEFLEKIPDLSGSPNIKHLNLSKCKNLVEVDDSVGFLDKLVKLDLSWCSNLTRFATRFGLRSLKELNLCGCTRLERFPEIEKDKMKSLWQLQIAKSGIRELPSSIAYLTGLTHLYANGCELQNVPDLSGSPNLRVLYLSDCASLVDVDDSVGFLDKLELLQLSGCSKLTRLTKLGSRSLFSLSLGGCRRLESFPEIENCHQSLHHLDIEKSGIRELPSIAYFTRLQTLKASGCELQNIQLLPFGKKVKFDEVSSCSTNLQLFLHLEGCNLSESDFLVPLDCWSALTQLNLSRNNFVSLPDCISKAVNLERLFLRDCKTLREIPILPPKLKELYLNDCTSLEKIPKLPPTLEKLNLCHCSGLSGDEVAKLENLLNEEFDPHSRLNIIYPGNEVPKWFRYTSNHLTAIQPLPKYKWDEYERKETYAGGSEFRFEIPLKLQAGKTLLGLALSFVLEPSTYYSHVKPWYYYVDDKCIFINGMKTFVPYTWYTKEIKANHVGFALVGLGKRQRDICQVVFRLRNGSPTKSCGVHCLLRNQDEPLHLSLRPTSSLGKRPRPHGSSDIVDDESDQQQQWLSSSSEPADDHPKCRQIDPNVPMDIEEDEEQEQPSDSDDP